jgi:curved DNA-binding protein CbpA
MGNDSSKQTIENQQMIMQLQQQILNQKSTPQFQQRIISPAELQQRSPHPGYPIATPHNINYPQSSSQQKSPPIKSLMDILHNKVLMAEIDKNPATKRKFLEKLLNEHRHIMTSAQVQRIYSLLESLPPAGNTSHAPGNASGHASANHSQQYLAGTAIPAIGFNQGTTRRDNEGRQIERTFQAKTIDELTAHYKTAAEQEEAEFRIEEQRRRKEFEEKQRQRRANYNSRLKELETNNVDALKIFNLQANYSLDDLKKAYKKLALRYHPDKPTGNEEQFQLITKCFMLLLEKYNNRQQDRPFNDLKQASKVYLEDQGKHTTINKQAPGLIDKDKFDVKLFNKIYEQNKLWDSNDDGYGSWFSSDKTDQDAPNELFGKKFNINVFNSAFEDYKDRITTENGAIMEYREPQELVSCATGFTDIDSVARKIEDFSKPSAIQGRSTRDLAYTDLKTAYTGRGAFIDPSKVEYKTYKSVDELKRDRGNIRFEMNDAEIQAYELKKIKEQEAEAKRQYLVQQRDTVIADSYSKIHEKMLGYRGSAPS